MKQLGPHTARRIDRATTIVARALGLIFGFGALGVSIWCFTIADAVSRPSGGPAGSVATFQRQMAPLVFLATWLVLGAPAALLGLWILKATLKGTAAHRWLQRTFMAVEEPVANESAARHHTRTQTARGSAQGVMSPSSSLSRSTPQQDSEALVNMPDDVRYAILARAAKTARVLGLVSGCGLVLLGVAGIVVAVVSGFVPGAFVPSTWYYLGAFRLEAAWVALSGLFILSGIAILRSTLSGPGERQSWLFRLRLFMMIVQARTMSGGRGAVSRQPALPGATSQGSAGSINSPSGEKEDRQ